jgi:hypothetical protein
LGENDECKNQERRGNTQEAFLHRGNYMRSTARGKRV